MCDFRGRVWSRSSLAVDSWPSSVSMYSPPKPPSPPLPPDPPLPPSPPLPGDPRWDGRYGFEEVER